MEGVNEFLDYMTRFECTLMFRGQRYFFNPIGKKGEGFYLDIYLEDLPPERDDEFYFQHIVGRSIIDCVRKMTDLPIWDGMTFWEAEREMSWAD